MSILPPGDLVVDVMKAADPRKQAYALARLEGLSVRGKVAGKQDLLLPPGTNPSGLQTARSTAAKTLSSQSPAQQFESFILSQSLEALLPKETQGSFGGEGQGMWRSLLAEKLADQMVKSGGLGIARLCDKVRKEG